MLSDKHKRSDLDRQVQKPINHPTADEVFMRNSKPQTESTGREDRNCLKIKVKAKATQAAECEKWALRLHPKTRAFSRYL